MAQASQSIAYHVQTFTGSRMRKIGTFFKADCRAPEVLRGKYVFLRFVSHDKDLFMYTRQSNGFSTPVFEKVKADGAIYMVTYSKESGRMLIGHVDAYVHEETFSQGLQTHAPLADCVILPNERPLNFPKAIDTITVQDEQPSEVEVKPINYQPTREPEKPKAVKGSYQKCGCYYENNQIERPCLGHKDMWEPVLKARAARGV